MKKILKKIPDPNDGFKKIRTKASGHVSEFRQKFREQLSTAMVAALALVIALTWQDVIKSFVEGIIDSKTVQQTTTFFARYPTLIKLFTAILITGICVTGVVLVTKLLIKKVENSQK